MNKLKIDAREYASQGAAILGIRDSGKTYTATEIAEELHDAGVPFVAFDPIGVWRFLRVPGKGKGYPIVVAGGEDGDLPLTPHNAAAIVRAAMEGGVSLVVDLFDPHLSKADWKRIVLACVETLLFENKKFGLRHIFVEEAAEFVPQMLPKDGLTPMVYSIFERLSRMGGNNRLGYTLINQRAEQVNKAVLELCDNLLLHRQKGKNSITSLGKWLDVAGVDGSKMIEKSLPTLPQGECWAWLSGETHATHVKVPTKNSFSPDRRAMRGDADVPMAKAVNTTKFVDALRTRLPEIEKEAQENDPAFLKAEIARLHRAQTTTASAPAPITPSKEELATEYRRGFGEGEMSMWPKAHRAGWDQGVREADQRWRAARDAFKPPGFDYVPEVVPHDVREAVNKSAAVVQRSESRVSAPKTTGSNPAGRSGKDDVRTRILRALGELEALGVMQPPRIQVAFLARYKHDGVPNFRNMAGALRTEGLIEYPTSETMALTPNGRASVPRDISPPANSGELHERIYSLLDGVHARILPHLIDAYPKAMDRDELAKAANYAHAGVPNFRNSLGKLRSLGFVGYPDTKSAIATDRLFLKGRV